MWKKAMYQLLILIIITGCTGLISGCNIGTKTKKEIVFTNPVPIPEASKGAPIIATNKEIPLAILNRPDFFCKRNIGGYVVTDPWFYQELLSGYEKYRALKRLPEYEGLVKKYKLKK